jgi:hypothetical protein
MSANEPIHAGDRCEVIDGLLGKDSPNIGLVVVVISYVGDHSKYGRIWRCEAEYAERGQPGKNVPDGQADFAQSWLRKLPPDAAPPQATTTDKEVTA